MNFYTVTDMQPVNYVANAHVHVCMYMYENTGQIKYTDTCSYTVYINTMYMKDLQ